MMKTTVDNAAGVRRCGERLAGEMLKKTVDKVLERGDSGMTLDKEQEKDGVEKDSG
jgi:hypothetical protein